MAWTVGPLAAFIVLIVLIMATGTPSSATLMSQATNSFGQVKRGTFNFQVSVIPQGDTAAQPSTITLKGPFELLPGKKLPLANIHYAISSGGQTQVIELLTTGDNAYTVVNGQAYSLPAKAKADLVSATKQLANPSKGKKSAGLSGITLNFKKWLINPQVGAGQDIDGTATWRTRAKVDVVAAIKDLTGSAKALSGVTGGALPSLKSADIAEIRKGIKDAQVEVYVGRYDHIVRKIDLTMDFVTPAANKATSDGVTGGKLQVLIGITQPNKPVDVQPPKNPLPYSALQSIAQTAAAAGATK